MADAIFHSVKCTVDTEGNWTEEWRVIFDPPLKPGEVVRVEVRDGEWKEFHG